MERLNKSITKKSGTAFECAPLALFEALRFYLWAYRNNFARINVYYEELNYQRIAQTKAYEVSTNR